MINYESILSVFDDKGTLLQWLKKVEKSLNESVLESINVIQNETNTQLQLKFNFKDGTSILTPFVDLPVGPQGETGPQGQIGATGPQGPAGTDGKSFNWMGAWVSGNEYRVDDVVENNGSSYICIQDVIGSTTAPVEDNTNWNLMAQAGQGGESQKMYLHDITIRRETTTYSLEVYINFYNLSPNKFVYQSFRDFLADNSCRIIVTGYYIKKGETPTYYPICSLGASGTQISASYIQPTGISSVSISSTSQFVDIVTEI